MLFIWKVSIDLFLKNKWAQWRNKILKSKLWNPTKLSFAWSSSVGCSVTNGTGVSLVTFLCNAWSFCQLAPQATYGSRSDLGSWEEKTKQNKISQKCHERKAAVDFVCLSRRRVWEQTKRSIIQQNERWKRPRWGEKAAQQPTVATASSFINVMNIYIHLLHNPPFPHLCDKWLVWEESFKHDRWHFEYTATWLSETNSGYVAFIMSK